MLKSILPTTPSQDADERKRFHAIFNDWLSQASEEEFAQLNEVRERFAPNQVCSVITLVRGCLTRQDLAADLPESLRQLLLMRNWPQAYAGAQVL